MYGGEKFQQVI